MSRGAVLSWLVALCAAVALACGHPGAQRDSAAAQGTTATPAEQGTADTAGLPPNTRVATAQPAIAPPPPVIAALEPVSPDTATLRWSAGAADVRYRLCAADPDVAGFTVCFDAGNGTAWPVGIPATNGAVSYLSLQACRAESCSPSVEAGAIGRLRDSAGDMYTLALALPDQRVRLAAYARSGAGVVQFYRGKAGVRELSTSTCTITGTGTACPPVDLELRGALAGVGATWAGGREHSITFRMQQPASVFLMFDDGTGIVVGEQYAVQTVLDEFGVKAAFFLTGKAMQQYPAAVRALVAAGHRVGNHTWSHPKLTTLSDDAIGIELDRAEEQFRGLVPGGTLRPCFRAPTGAFDARVLAVVQAHGARQITQNVSSEDYTGVSAEEMTRRMMTEIRDGAIVSFHTQMPQTVIALRTIVPLLIAQGFTFKLVC